MPIEVNVPVGFGLGSFFGGIGITSTEIWALTFGIDVATPPYTQANNDGLLDDFINDFAPILSSNYSIQGLRMSIAQDGDPLVFTSEDPTFGARPGGSEEPPQIAALVRKNTGVGGRRNRGRWYLPGVLNDADVDMTGGITTTRRTAIQDQMNLLFSAFSASNNITGMVILHSWDTATPPVPAPNPTPVAALAVQQFVGTQRRRLEGFRP